MLIVANMFIQTELKEQYVLFFNAYENFLTIFSPHGTFIEKAM